MALNNMSDGVGRKIVEALKMHDEVSYQDETLQGAEESILETPATDFKDDNIQNIASDTYSANSDVHYDVDNMFQTESFSTQMPAPSFVDAAFNQSLANNLGSVQYDDDFNYPANVAVLKQLIAKLPAGVSKLTGALIIKQTMEALGISMNSVLQEAKQVQDTFVNNAKECQDNIIDYRKQISILELKAQQYQKQSVLMGDIINLFNQTGIR